MRPATPPSPQVTAVRFTPAPAGDARQGLLGFVAARIDGLQVDGIALRRTLSGRLDLRYPERRGGNRDRAHPVVRPVDEPTRQAIEAQVMAALRAQGNLQ